MINTYNVKQAQLKGGSYKVGTGEKVILLIGSCRSIMYLNYLDKYNRENGNPFTIHHLDPFNHGFDADDKLIDLEVAVQKLETNETLLNLLKSTDIYIHEYYQHFGMFNSDPKREKNIYQFGLKPTLEICVPNFNDLFILFNDLLTFDEELKILAKSDLASTGVLSKDLQDAMRMKGEAAIEKFYDVCRLSSIPQMENYFKEYYKKKRFFWSYNHITTQFSLSIFWMMNKAYLNFNLTDQFWQEITAWDDMFKHPSTGLTQYDVDNYGFEWNETLTPLNI